LWFFAAGLCRERSHNPGNASRRVPRSSRVLPGRTWPCPAAETAKHDASPELRFPSAQARPGDPRSRACLTRSGPPSGFGYPPDGFRPPDPGRPCFVPTALLGFVTPFEALLLPEGTQGHYALSVNLRAVSPTAAPAPAETNADRTGRPRLPGFDPSGSPLPGATS